MGSKYIYRGKNYIYAQNEYNYDYNENFIIRLKLNNNHIATQLKF